VRGGASAYPPPANADDDDDEPPPCDVVGARPAARVRSASSRARAARTSSSSRAECFARSAMACASSGGARVYPSLAENVMLPVRGRLELELYALAADDGGAPSDAADAFRCSPEEVVEYSLAGETASDELRYVDGVRPVSVATYGGA
jgi:hypothetical protein